MQHNIYLTIATSKAVNKNAVLVGDVLTYTISLTSGGNTSSSTTLFVDTIPNGTTLVPGSFNQDGTIIAGSPNPPGIQLPNIIQNNATVGYSFIGDPSVPTTISGIAPTNTVFTTVINATLPSAKAVNTAFSYVGDTLTYTIVLTNTGNTTTDNVIFTDTFLTGTTLVPNSVTINGTTQGGADPSPPTGVPVGTMIYGDVSTITFQVTVNTLPTINPIVNTGDINYTYTSEPSIPNVSVVVTSNPVTTQVNVASLGGIGKSVDKAYATCGDILTYTITVPNSGNVSSLNVILVDTLLHNIVFIPNSITVNGTATTDTPANINVSTIPPLSNSVIIFNAIV